MRHFVVVIPAVAFVGACSFIADLGPLSGDGGVDASAETTPSDAALEAACDAGAPDPAYLNGVVEVAAGQYFLGTESAFACALLATGEVACWGGNKDGTLGAPAGGSVPAATSTPRVVSGLPKIAHIAAGNRQVCAVEDAPNARLYCWGKTFGTGPFDGGVAPDVPAPVLDSFSKSPWRGVVSVSAADNHVCAIDQGQAVRCWGENAKGQLGTGTTSPSSYPTLTKITGGATAVAAGEFHTCALHGSSSGPVVDCWGSPEFGALGIPIDGGLALNPVRFDIAAIGGGAPTQLRVGLVATCVIDATAKVYCSGTNTYAQLGQGVGKVATPTQINGFAQTAELTVGQTHSCRVRTDGVTECIGDNQSGQLGRGYVDNALHFDSAPVLPSADGGALEGGWKVTAGGGLAFGFGTNKREAFSCAIVRDRCGANGSVACWGDNTYGELGDGTTKASSLPVKVLAPK